MSCKECEKIQKLAFDKNIAESTPLCYVRVGVANVAVVGCRKHLKELLKQLRGE